MILDPLRNTSMKVYKKGAQIDIGSTLLHYLGIDQKVGIGVSLLSSTPTLTESQSDINKYLSSKKEDFKQLWGFPSLKKSKILVNTTQKSIKIKDHTYTIPILIKVNKDLSTTPYFNNNSNKSLESYIESFHKDDVFIWIDKCQKLNQFKKSNSSTSMYCLIFSSLSGHMLSHPINDEISINPLRYLQKIKNNKITMDNFKINYDKLVFLKTLEGLSTNYLSLLTRTPLNSHVYIPNLGSKATVDKMEKLFKRKIITTLSHSNQHYALKTNIKSFIHILDASKFLNLSPLKTIVKNKIKEMMNSFLNLKLLIQYEPIIFKVKPLPRPFKWGIIERDRFIAHAGGEIEGHTYTNSLEALNLSYKKGFRYFELDFQKTSDGIFVAAHSWSNWAGITNYTKSLPPSSSEFKKYKIRDKFTPITIDEINMWFKERTDAYLVTDKVNSPKDFISQFKHKDRLIMELFSINALKEGINSNIYSAMPTWDLVKTFKPKLLKKLQELKIKHVAASRRVIESEHNTLITLKKNGIKTYVFHVNFDKGKDEEFVSCYERKYLYGLYADKWTFKEKDKCKQLP